MPAVRLFQRPDEDVPVRAHNGILFLLPCFCAVAIHVAAGPDGQMHIVTVTGFGAHAAVALKFFIPLLKGGVTIVAESPGEDIAVVPSVAVASHDIHDQLQHGSNGLLYKDVVMEAHIAVEDGHKPCNLCPMRKMIRRVTGRVHCPGSVVRTDSHSSEPAGNQVVHHRHTLTGQLDGPVGEQHIVINQCGAVGDLNKDVLAERLEDGYVQLLRYFIYHRQRVVVEEVPGYPGSLCLPVQPQSPGAVVDVVSTDDCVDGSMHFDAADFRPGQILLVVDVVNVAVLNDGEYASQMSHNAGLTAVVNIAAADNMGTDGLL